MKIRGKIKSKIFNYIQLKKKYIKKLFNLIIILELLKIKFYQGLYFFLSYSYLSIYKKDYLVSYIIYFCFFLSNTVVHLSNASGKLKFLFSAGLINLQGKQKTTRKLALIRFFNILFLAKSKILKKNPVALYFKNISNSNKFIIIKKLKQNFFIKTIKTFDLEAYNGCRKKKERRK